MLFYNINVLVSAFDQLLMSNWNFAMIFMSGDVEQWLRMSVNIDTRFVGSSIHDTAELVQSLLHICWHIVQNSKIIWIMKLLTLILIIRRCKMRYFPTSASCYRLATRTKWLGQSVSTYAEISHECTLFYAKIIF